ncbi:exo-alpha-sialidase [Bacteroidales bacterium OttesenSCG-928-M11]|nr:exo-alpha-sialidase [Bacteroidales bacterium OttesenSCG-928-M11]
MKTHLKIYFTILVTCFSVSTMFSQSGNSLKLNGIDQLMLIASHEDFNITTEESFSITCWVKLDQFVDTQSAQRFITKRCMDGSPKSGYELWGGKNGTNNFYANNAPNTDGNHNNSMSVWSTKGGKLGNWFHIAFVVDRKEKKMYLYHEGEKVGDSGSKNISPWYVENDYDVVVGAGRPTASTYGYYMKGEIDNLRFWKKALSSTEIFDDQTSAVDSNTADLVAAYDFEDVSEYSVPDISGNNHTGTLVNYPLPGVCEIENIKLTQDINYTGKGNQNEVILKAAIQTKGNESVSFQSIKFNTEGTTNIKDISRINIYSTGNINKFDWRDVSSATLLGSCQPSEEEITCPLSGELIPGINYLWITYNIDEDAKEGNAVDAEILSLSTENERFELIKSSEEGYRTILLSRQMLYSPGDYGSKNYRIPAIITAKDGSIVIATDKRKNNEADLPQDIDILINRSTDNGKTWSDPLTIATGTGYEKGFGDAGLVRTNEENGLLCIFVGGPGLFQSTPTNPIRTYISKSLDNGITWTKPKDITDQLYGSKCSDAERKNWYGSFCASGNGLLTRDGRIMFVSAVRETSGGSLSNYVFYSDDNGETWNVSKRAMSGGDESKVVELNDGTILMSIRRQSKGARYYTKSTDKGITWSKVSSWFQLIEPNCNGDIIRYTSTIDGYDKNRLLHSIPNHSSSRQNVSVFLSYDEGKTWPIKKTICPGGSAYSSLTILPDGTIGAYVEESHFSEGYSLIFLNFTLDWLTNGNDTYTEPEDTGIKDISQTSGIDIYINEEKNIIIKNAPIGSYVRIYGLSGILVTKAFILSEELKLSVNETPAVYIVQINNNELTFSKKVAIG